jgi:hypothetical protein
LWFVSVLLSATLLAMVVELWVDLEDCLEVVLNRKTVQAVEPVVP